MLPTVHRRFSLQKRMVSIKFKRNGNVTVSEEVEIGLRMKSIPRH